MEYKKNVEANILVQIDTYLDNFAEHVILVIKMLSILFCVAGDFVFYVPRYISLKVSALF